MYFKKNAEEEKQKDKERVDNHYPRNQCGLNSCQIQGSRAHHTDFLSVLADLLSVPEPPGWPMLITVPKSCACTSHNLKISLAPFWGLQWSCVVDCPQQSMGLHHVHYSTECEKVLHPTCSLTHFSPDFLEPVNHSSGLLHADNRGSDYKSTAKY